MTAWGWIAVAVGIVAVLLCGAAYVLATVATVRRLPKGKKAAAAPWDAHQTDVDREVEWFYSQCPQNVEIKSDDGLMLRGRYLPVENAKSAILLMHGYRAQTGEVDFVPLLRFYRERGMSILVVDQRAHAKSEGKYICFGVKERYDCKRWLEWLNQKTGAQDLFMAGLSMGAATVLMATGLSLPKNLRGVIADCGYTTPWAICAHVLRTGFHLPVWPMLSLANLFVRAMAGFSLKGCSATEALAKNHSIPVLFIHGADDAFVPTQMGRDNYAACNAPKRLVVVPGAGHGMSAWVDGERVKREIKAFLEENESKQA